MNEEFLKKVTKFVFKNEMLLLILILIFFGLKLLHFPGRNIIVIVGLQSIALLYVITSLNHNKEHSKKEQFTTKITGLGSGVLLVGILFKLLHWPGSNMQLIVGSIVILALLIYSSIKEELIIKKETKLRLVIILIIGLFLYFLTPTFEPNESQLYTTIIDDFEIERILETPVTDKNTIAPNSEEFTLFLQSSNLELVSSKTHEYYQNNHLKLWEDSAYFSISKPLYSENKSIVKIYITYNCGMYCSFDGQYLYNIRDNKWHQVKLISGSEW